MATLEQIRSSLQQFKQRGFGPKGNVEASTMLPQWYEVVERILFIVEKLIEQQFSISNNSNLSLEGKQVARTKLAVSARGDLKPLGDKHRDTQAALDRVKSICLDYMVVPKGDAAVQELRAREVRDVHRSKARPELDAVFVRAAEAGDAEVMRALQAGPGGPLIQGEMLARAEQIYAERRDPDKYQRWQELEVLLSHIEGLANHAAMVLLTLSLGADRPEILAALGLPADKEDPMVITHG